MAEQRYQTFREFWPFYLREHSKRTTRAMHYVGTTGVVLIVLGAILARSPLYLLLAPLSGYSWAWVSHFFIEKNRPATFKYPLWSLFSDFRMYALAIVGQLDRELDAAGVAREGAAASSATQRS
jgi:hypothetical protein